MPRRTKGAVPDVPHSQLQEARPDHLVILGINCIAVAQVGVDADAFDERIGGARLFRQAGKAG